MKKDLVLYYSKNNTTQETVEKIKRLKNNKVNIINIKDAPKIKFDDIDRIFIGTGIYMGGIPQKVKAFIKKYHSDFKNKKIVFFIHGIISKDIYNDIVYKAVNNLIDKNNIEIIFLGGKLDIMKQNFIIRKLLIEVAKQNNFDPYNANTIDNNQIDKFLNYFK